jgi:tyrosinase
MRYSQVLTFGLGLLLQTTTAIPTSANTDIHSRQDTCTSPPLRKSWDDATAEEKQAYTDAAVCLTKIPSRLGPVPSTLHDDFSWVHNTLALKIHLVAAFLPWHRLFVHTYEKALQTECGYTGTMLYWDWVKDAEAPASASVWDSFGGDGVSPDGSPFSYCVRDGPFKDYEPVYYANDTRPHCLLRNFAGPVDEGWPEMLGFLYRQEVVDQILLEPEFLTFHQQLENGPHAGVHAGIAGFAGIGDMSPTTSPNGMILQPSISSVPRVTHWIRL